MPYEDKAGLNVNNYYGPRDTGGTAGVTRTAGVENEYVMDLDAEGIAVGFPSPSSAKGQSLWVTGVDETQASGSVSGVTIGGVAVEAATEAAPVEIAPGNSGEVVASGANGGKLVINFNRYPLA